MVIFQNEVPGKSERGDDGSHSDGKLGLKKKAGGGLLTVHRHMATLTVALDHFLL
jgi:hypothetical protein